MSEKLTAFDRPGRKLKQRMSDRTSLPPETILEIVKRASKTRNGGTFYALMLGSAQFGEELPCSDSDGNRHSLEERTLFLAGRLTTYERIAEIVQAAEEINADNQQALVSEIKYIQQKYDVGRFEDPDTWYRAGDEEGSNDDDATDDRNHGDNSNNNSVTNSDDLAEPSQGLGTGMGVSPVDQERKKRIRKDCLGK